MYQVFNLSYINRDCKILITKKILNNLKIGSESALNLIVIPTQKNS